MTISSTKSTLEQLREMGKTAAVSLDSDTAALLAYFEDSEEVTSFSEDASSEGIWQSIKRRRDIPSSAASAFHQTRLSVIFVTITRYLFYFFSLFWILVCNDVNGIQFPQDLVAQTSAVFTCYRREA